MKRLFFAVLAFAAVLAAPATSQEKTYRLIAVVEDQVGFLEMETQQRAGDQVTATMLWIFSPPKRLDALTIVSAYRRNRYDCTHRTAVQLQVRAVASDGIDRPELTFIPDPKPDPLSPGTAGETIGQVLCDVAQPAGADALSAAEAQALVRRAEQNGGIHRPGSFGSLTQTGAM